MLSGAHSLAPDAITHFCSTPNNPHDVCDFTAPPGTPSQKEGIISPTLRVASPPERAWVSLASPRESDGHLSDAHTEKFTVLSYNILCENYAIDKYFPHSPASVRKWQYRKNLILEELIQRDADILCLQEVEVAQYQDYFLTNLKGYEGVYWPKSQYKKAGPEDQRKVDGCATFYKKSKYTLFKKHLIEFNTLAMLRSDFNEKGDVLDNRVLDKNNIAVLCLLKSIETGRCLAVANTHIYWNENEADVKLVQVALLLDEVQIFTNGFAKHSEDIAMDASTPPTTFHTNTSKIPLIVCGDFNSTPCSKVYNFLSGSDFSPTDPNIMCRRYPTTGLRHNLELKSAYAGCGELPMTTHTPGFKDVIDYIWYGSANLEVDGVLGKVDRSYLSAVVGFPNAHFPSDHICIMGAFHTK